MTRAEALRFAADRFEAELEKLPVGHEHAHHGCSTYNWGKHYARVIRALLAQEDTGEAG